MSWWKLVGLALVLAVLIGVSWFQILFAPTESNLVPGVTLGEMVDGGGVESGRELPGRTPTVLERVTDLEVPWEIRWLPDDSLLITERAGRLVRAVPKNLIQADTTVISVPGVEEVGESGLLGLALHPDFSQNNFVYLYITARAPAGSEFDLINRVERYVFRDNTLSQREIILDTIPGAKFHDGGRIDFGSDGFLYITTGDATKPNLAQNINSLAGKILRVREDGSIPSDNPFGNAVWSYGHRNPQGLAWDDRGRLWATEHGRSGIRSGFDELNLIEKGGNYGWPDSEGDTVLPNTIGPVVHSGADETWAPAGMAFYDGSLWFGGLRGESLYQFEIASNSLTRHLAESPGRIRVVRYGPDGFLYIATSNRDGRGTVRTNDDQVMRIDPVIFAN